MKMCASVQACYIYTTIQKFEIIKTFVFGKKPFYSARAFIMSQNFIFQINAVLLNFLLIKKNILTLIMIKKKKFVEQ